MRYTLGFVLLSILPLTTSAQGLEAHRWTNRLLLVFTPTTDHTLFLQQYEQIGKAAEALTERKIMVIMMNPEGDRENSGRFLQRSESEYYYDYFSVSPHRFEMVLVGLDGQEKFRAKDVLTPMSVVTELVDDMPMRRRELREPIIDDGR